MLSLSQIFPKKSSCSSKLEDAKLEREKLQREELDLFKSQNGDDAPENSNGKIEGGE